MKFSADHHFIYITAHTDENKQQLQSYYKLIENYLEEITNEWLVEFLFPTEPIEMSDVDNPETAPDTAKPNKKNKT
jgi:gamma-glutamylcysteine synthetase